MREKDLVYLLKHLDSDAEYAKDLQRAMHSMDKLLEHIQSEHILDTNPIKMHKLHEHITESLLLTCEICSGVPRSQYKSDETLEEYLKSKDKISAMWNKTAVNPHDVKAKKTDESLKKIFYKNAIEYLKTTNIQKVTIKHVIKYVVSNTYQIDGAEMNDSLMSSKPQNNLKKSANC